MRISFHLGELMRVTCAGFLRTHCSKQLLIKLAREKSREHRKRQCNSVSFDVCYSFFYDSCFGKELRLSCLDLPQGIRTTNPPCRRSSGSIGYKYEHGVKTLCAVISTSDIDQR